MRITAALRKAVADVGACQECRDAIASVDTTEELHASFEGYYVWLFTYQDARLQALLTPEIDDFAAAYPEHALEMVPDRLSAARLDYCAEIEPLQALYADKARGRLTPARRAACEAEQERRRPKPEGKPARR